MCVFQENPLLCGALAVGRSTTAGGLSVSASVGCLRGGGGGSVAGSSGLSVAGWGSVSLAVASIPALAVASEGLLVAVSEVGLAAVGRLAESCVISASSTAVVSPSSHAKAALRPLLPYDVNAAGSRHMTGLFPSVVFGFNVELDFLADFQRSKALLFYLCLMDKNVPLSVVSCYEAVSLRPVFTDSR